MTKNLNDLRKLNNIQVRRDGIFYRDRNIVALDGTRKTAVVTRPTGNTNFDLYLINTITIALGFGPRVFFLDERYGFRGFGIDTCGYQRSPSGTLFRLDQDTPTRIVNFMAEKDYDEIDLTGLKLGNGNGEFEGYSFRNAKLNLSGLNSQSFAHCDFRGADLTGATAGELVFIGCDLRGARFNQFTANHLTIRGARSKADATTTFSGASINYLRMERATNSAGANFAGATIRYAINYNSGFTRNDLTGATVTDYQDRSHW